MDKSRLKEIIREELKNVLIENTGYTVVYRDRALDKTYTAEIPPGISKTEIKQMLKKVVRVGLEIIDISPIEKSVTEASDDTRLSGPFTGDELKKMISRDEETMFFANGQYYQATSAFQDFKDDLSVMDKDGTEDYIDIKDIEFAEATHGFAGVGIDRKKRQIPEGAISPRDAKKLSIGDIVKTQKNTYKITGYGNKSNAFRQFEVEDVKGKKYNIQVSLRGNSDILVAPGRSLRFTEPGEMLEASDVWKAFDAKMKLYDQSMDIEDQMFNISAELQTAYEDMEQEAEPGGVPIADRYGKEIEALQTNHKNLKAKLDQVFAKLDKLEQY